MDRINHYFSRIAHKYKDLRTTDLLSLSIIRKKVDNLEKALRRERERFKNGFSSRREREA